MNRPAPLALLLLTSLTALLLGAGCSDAQGADPSTDPVASESALTAVEDVHQYDNSRSNGLSATTGVDLGNLEKGDPATRADFETADCIVGRLTKFHGRFRPYNLQSFKTTSGGHHTFIFKRMSENIIGEAPSECLKIKLSAVVGATDAFVTIERVKALPAPRPDGLCADNGEI